VASVAAVSDLSFRTATTDDVAAIVALVTSAYRGEASTAGWTSEDHLLKGQRTDPAMVTEAITDPTGTVVLAERDGRLLGCIQLTRTGQRDAHFGMFAVDPTLQAGGVGSALLTHAEDLARDEWGCTSMDLEVIAQRDQLIAYYHRRGYEPTGETTPFPYGDERYGIPQRDDLHFVVLRRSLWSPRSLGRRLVREMRPGTDEGAGDHIAADMLRWGGGGLDDEDLWEALLGALDEAETDTDLWFLGDGFIPESIATRDDLAHRLEALEADDARMRRVVELDPRSFRDADQRRGPDRD